ncbi:hypothetical protein ACQR35_01805 [Pseudarthrobacter sp. J1738]|uniref:hypothetical protein n=1 Tax=Pseudarthrobacter sp. J1738 TaxID=3420446 RepID=UPI003D28DCD7
MTRHHLDLEFWGVLVSARCESAATAEHLRHYFRDYEVDAGVPADLDIIFTGEGLPFSSETQSFIRYAGEPGWREIGAAEPTVLPPLGHPRLRNAFRTVHASAAVPPQMHKKALLLTGISTAGKSTILLELLRRGWGFIADDTVLVSENNTLCPFTRPIGIRQATADRSPWLTKYLDKSPAFETPTGITRMVHAKDLGAWVPESETPWSWTVLLVPSGSFSTIQLGPSTIEMNLDISTHLNLAVEAITDFVGDEQ